MKNKFNSFFFIYINFIFILAIYYLYQKHTVGNDSTISEWIINYQGGFTRRGLIGEICFQVANKFNLQLRFVIFLIQSFIYFIYSIIIFLYLKDSQKNCLIIIALFSPIFLLYPIAEIEVLARKEIFLYIGFIIFLFLSSINLSKNIPLIYIFFIYPILYLIWEPFILFSFFSILVILIRNFNSSLKKVVLKCMLSFSSTVIVIAIIVLDKFNAAEHNLMKESLMINFNESCYMSCAYLSSKSSIKAQFASVYNLLSIEVIFRYSLILLIGFMPLMILAYNSKFKSKIFFLPNNFLLVLLSILTPVIILFSAGTDWGRWVNMSYTFSILTFFYLLKNNFIKINNKIKFFDDFNLRNKKISIIFFIFFAFMWNPKTGMTGDVATNSLYKIIYNTSKSVFKFQSIRLFQDSPIIKFHKEFIE